MKTRVHIAKTQDPYRGACEALDALGFRVRGKRVFIKPNLTGNRPSNEGMGIDTGLVRAVLERLEDCPAIAVGESCSKTDRAFVDLGYTDLGKKYPQLKLLDMRFSEQVWKPIPRPRHTKAMPFAAEIFEYDYLVNIAKMKTHSLAGVTLCLKNVFGFIPTRRQKLMYHPFIRAAVLDMNQVIESDFCLVDGVWGNEFDEIQSAPVNAGVVIGGENLLAVDEVAAAVMGIDVGAMNTYQTAWELFGKPEIEQTGAPLSEVCGKFRQGCLLSTRFRYIKEAAGSLCYRAVCRH
ncbi:MAG: DUF362 domain-containing protein [Candidatus Aureabacteria bacterium]|nr:DUF362 domain-containing protein [Candidatus Auribacterota bacterium]